MILAIFFAASIVIWISTDSEKEKQDVSLNQLAAEDANKSGGKPLLQEKDIEQRCDEIESKSLPAACELEVPLVYQEPELPTGCESVALTMLLLYEGFDLDKTTIADEYLLYSKSGDFSEGYVGDPYSNDGAGCFPPSLAETANLYLEKNDSGKRAVNLSGRSFEKLLQYIADGIPVAVWTTISMSDTSFYEEGFEEDGISYNWYDNEHCVVLSGYDLVKRTLTVNDSLDGVVIRDLDSFEYLYDIIGRFAIVIL